MRLRPEQLEDQLAANLSPAYLISGDETLLVEEAGDRVRAAARSQGIDEREVFDVGKDFDWNALMAATDNLSLFSTRRLLELRFAAKLGADHGKALTKIVSRPSGEDVILVFAPKLDAKAVNAAKPAAWFKALEAHMVIVQVWPVDHARLPRWIGQRMQARGLQPDAGAVRLLAERVEGNLLACVQEIEKLALLNGPGPVSAERVADVVADSARFDVFGLVDAALEGVPRRTVRILYDLREEGVEPVLVLWALSRGIREMARMVAEVRAGTPVPRVMDRYKVWGKRQAVVGKALQRLTPGRCRSLLLGAARIDRVIKGVEPGAPWDDLLGLSLGLAGVTLQRR